MRAALHVLALLHGCATAPSARAPRAPGAEGTRPAPPFRLTVVAIDYATRAPLARVAVTVAHDVVCTGDGGCVPTHPHPPELVDIRRRTDREGRAVFDLPDPEYHMLPYGHGLAGYLDPIRSVYVGRFAEADLVRRTRSADGRAMSVQWFLVPESFFFAHRIVETPEGAIEIARRSLSCNDDRWRVEVQDNLGNYQVDFRLPGDGFVTVVVDAIDGTARVTRPGPHCGP